MSFWVSRESMGLQLAWIATSTMQAVCNAAPQTYFNAVWPELWVADTLYTVGTLVRPGTFVGFIYECVEGGTSGSLEPSWGNVQDGEFYDNTAKWKTHENYSLSNTSMESGDFSVIEESDGLRLDVIEKTGVTTHTTGVVSHTALCIDSSRKLAYVGESETTLEGDNTITSGRATIFREFYVKIEDPVEDI